MADSAFTTGWLKFGLVADGFVVVFGGVSLEFKVHLANHAADHHVEHAVCNKRDAVGQFPQFRTEDCQDLADAS